MLLSFRYGSLACLWGVVRLRAVLTACWGLSLLQQLGVAEWGGGSLLSCMRVSHTACCRACQDSPIHCLLRPTVSIRPMLAEIWGILLWAQLSPASVSVSSAALAAKHREQALG